MLTQNVWGKAPPEIAAAALARVLDHDPDVVALQEWPAARDRLLTHSGAFVRMPGLRRAVRRRPWSPVAGMVWSRPVLRSDGPVGLRADRYELLGCRAVTLTGWRRVRPTPTHTDAVMRPNRATLVVARDHARGEDVAVIGYHLWAGVQVRGRYSERPEDRARVAGHRAQAAALGRLVAEQLDRGRVVYALGDSNFDGLTLPGVESAWSGREREPRGTIQASRRKIDDVFGPGPAEEVVLVTHPEEAVDHQGVLAVRRR